MVPPDAGRVTAAGSLADITARSDVPLARRDGAVSVLEAGSV